MIPRVLVVEEGLKEVRVREVHGHTALDILRAGLTLVVCVRCAGTWVEGGYPPKECAADLHVGKGA